MWLKLDDGFWCHPKVVALSDAAVGVLVKAMCYSAQQLTDGVLTGPVAVMLSSRTPSALDELVSAGLLERNGESYAIHDYLEYNPSAKEVRKSRAQTSVARAKAGRKGMASKWGKSEPSANSLEKSDNKSITKRQQTDSKPITPLPLPSREELSLPNPPLASESEGTQSSLRPPEIETPPPTPRCSTVEHTQTIDTQAIRFALAAKIPALALLPGDCEYKLAAAIRGLVAGGQITEATWKIAADWFATGGARMAPKGRPSWQWLVGHGGGPLAKCLSTAIEWDTKGRPSLDDHGIPTSPPKPVAERKPPEKIPVVSSSLAYLRDGKRMTPEAFAAASTQIKAEMAAEKAAIREAQALEVSRAS